MLRNKFNQLSSIIIIHLHLYYLLFPKRHARFYRPVRVAYAAIMNRPAEQAPVCPYHVLYMQMVPSRGCIQPVQHDIGRRRAVSNGSPNDLFASWWHDLLSELISRDLVEIVERLKRFRKTPASCPTQILRTQGQMLWGPLAFLVKLHLHLTEDNHGAVRSQIYIFVFVTTLYIL